MTCALLDVNVLLALLDADHVDHQRTRTWLASQIDSGWASCALTQNGFVRVISQPRYPNPVSPAIAISRLRRAVSTEYHSFWSCDVSLLDSETVDRSRIHGSRQVTDAYLLALAVSRSARFVTFDRSIPLDAIAGAQDEHLEIL